MGDPIVIDSPELQAWAQRLFFSTVTLLLWTFWTYLWLPIVRLAAWTFGIEGDYQSFVMKGYEALGHVALPYGMVVAALGGSLLLWATYNFLRFRGLDRRRPRAPLETDALAKDYGVNLRDLNLWQAARRLVVSHKDNGRVEAVVAEGNVGDAGMQRYARAGARYF